MSKKKQDRTYAIALSFIVIIALSGLFAITGSEAVIADEPSTGGVSGGVVTPWYPYYQDYPNVMTFKGVAVKGDDIVSAVLIAIDKNKPDNIYMIVDGEITKMKLDDVDYNREKQTAVVYFDEAELVVKFYGENYRNIAIMTGKFNGYVLNMKADYSTQIYDILKKPIPIETEPTPTNPTNGNGNSNSGKETKPKF